MYMGYYCIIHERKHNTNQLLAYDRVDGEIGMLIGKIQLLQHIDTDIEAPFESMT